MNTLAEWYQAVVSIVPEAQPLEAAVLQSFAHEASLSAERTAKFDSYNAKALLHAMSSEQSDWVYVCDWKAKRDEVARDFEGLLGLPADTLRPSLEIPIPALAGDANDAADQTEATERRLFALEPFDDDWLFLVVSPTVWAQLCSNDLVWSPGAEPTPAIQLTRDDEIWRIDSLSNDALNLVQNMGIRTVGELLDQSPSRLRRVTRTPAAVSELAKLLAAAGFAWG